MRHWWPHSPSSACASESSACASPPRQYFQRTAVATSVTFSGMQRHAVYFCASVPAHITSVDIRCETKRTHDARAEYAADDRVDFLVGLRHRLRAAGEARREVRHAV